MDKTYLTVTALTKYMKARMDRDPHLQDVWLKGEISNYKLHSRGHMYFTLKDENARITAVMFANQNRTLAFRPAEGMKVLVRGQVSLYEAGGSYQLYVNQMQPDGIGSLYLAFEQLKQRLQQEGLFSGLYKKELPRYPQTVGVVTSPTGAAIRDVITTIRRRHPSVNIVVFPVLVQGEHAAPSIVSGIRQANDLRGIDVLIVGRGGGSIEELWAFNEETVARAIFASDIPVISAVGHETDTTIADFVADVRAATPTAAAELAVPSMAELEERIGQRTLRLQRAMREQVSAHRERLQTLQKSYAFRYPKQLYAQKEEQLDRALDRLQQVKARYVERKQVQVKQLMLTVQKHHPAQQLLRSRERREGLQRQLQREMQGVMREKADSFARLMEKLHVLSPLRIMMRGYSLVYNEQKQVLKSVKQIEPGEAVTVQLQDGQVQCHVWGIEEREVTDGANKYEL